MIRVVLLPRCDAGGPDKLIEIDRAEQRLRADEPHAAGVCSSSGIRSSAKCWFSTLTPSHTFGSGQPDPSAPCARHAKDAARVARHPHPLGALRQHLKRVLRPRAPSPRTPRR
jgi:hypothetical protein